LNQHKVNRMASQLEGEALLEAVASIRLVQEYLGHSTIAVAEIYTHVMQDQLDSAVACAFE